MVIKIKLEKTRSLDVDNKNTEVIWTCTSVDRKRKLQGTGDSPVEAVRSLFVLVKDRLEK